MPKLHDAIIDIPDEFATFFKAFLEDIGTLFS